MPSSEPQTILITGANRGLGLATAQRLAHAGHRLILTTRDDLEARAVAQLIEWQVPGASVTTRVVDLASLDSVRELVTRLIDEGERIDVLVHNAGMLFPAKERTLTADGIEESLQVHAVAPLLLTRLLLPIFARPARIWALGSSLHHPRSRGPAVDFRHDDPNLDTRYHPRRAYKNSKLALLWVAYEFERRLGARGIHFDVVCPGFVPTTAAEGAPSGLQRFALRRILPLMPFATSRDDAADSLAAFYGQTPPTDPGGRYFRKGSPVASSPRSRDGKQAVRFWRWACERVGLSEELDESY